MTGFVVALADCAGLPDARVGGKARGLGRAIAGGLPVPPGVCVTADALEVLCAAESVRPVFDRFVTAVRRQPAHRSAAAAALRAALATATLPDALAGEVRRAVGPLLARGPVAIRSSAAGEDGDTSARAGVYTSVIGADDEDAVFSAIRRCWISLYTSRAMAAVADGQATQRMAVVLQEMVHAAQTGVLFTVDPVVPRPDTIVVEYAQGSHDAVTSGNGIATRVHIGPDSEPPELPLTAEAFREIGRRLEGLFEGPVDAEWAVLDGHLTILQARKIVTARPVGPGWALQEDLSGMNRLRLGRCQPMFARSLQKKVWFRKACQEAGFHVYGVAYLTYRTDHPEPVAYEVLDRMPAEVLQVNLGDGARAVRRADLVDHLRRHGARNPVGDGHSAAQVGELVLADTTGFSTMMADGSQWIEVFPAGVDGIKSGARQPTVYRVGPDGQVLDRKTAVTTEVSHYDLTTLGWRTVTVGERPVEVSAVLLDHIADYTRTLSQALGEARLEWYAVGDQLFAKDVSLESAALPTSGDVVVLATGVGEGPVLHIDDLAALDAYADLAGVSVYAHGDEEDRHVDPLSARLAASPVAPIVVAEYPSIGLIPSIRHVAGFVFSRGTLLSHTAIALREQGVPAVIDEASARTLRDGDVVMISSAGVVGRPHGGRLR